MKIFDTKIITYQIIPIDTKIAGWGAKGKIYTEDGVIETEEALGRTKDEAEQKAKVFIEKISKLAGK
jgi:hypothetical protein